MARRLGVTASSASRGLAQLERSGWVRRASWPGDRRISRIEMTEAGRSLWEQASRTLDHELDAGLQRAGLRREVRPRRGPAVPERRSRSTPREARLLVRTRGVARVAHASGTGRGMRNIRVRSCAKRSLALVGG
ncbi:MarR family transcriptional regulator [Streptomyces luteolifulvus]|uniref:MarR family transcriptional regulator n=1 Tax=Streptomyces luteolifulvus TaxID=2615112 RepID=UPI001CD9D131